MEPPAYQITTDSSVFGWGYFINNESDEKTKIDNLKKLKAYVDVNARVSFVYNSRLSAYVQANNAIAQKYAIWGGFPAQRIQAFMGATYSF